MLRTLAALAALSAVLVSASAQTGPPPAALLAAISATDAAKAPFAFDFEVQSEEQNWRARYDPGAEPRLRLLSPEALDNNGQRAFDRVAERMEGLPWCASTEMGGITGVQRLREDAAAVTYSFQPTRESIRGEQARSFANRLRGEFVITKDNPDLTRVRIYTPAAFSPMPLVRVERLDIAITCATAPNGRRYAAETISDVRGSAFGQAFDEHSVQRTRNPRPTP